MSYILDALKKADAERERGAVPGLHSQHQAPAPDEDDEARAPRSVPLVWVGAGVAATVIAVLSWQLMSRGANEPDTVTQAPVAMAPAPDVTPPPQAPVMPSPMPPQAPAAEMPAPAPLPNTPPVVQTPSSRSAGSGHADAMPASPATAPVASPTPRPPQASGNAGPAGKTAMPAAEGRIPSYNELPDDIRREIPMLTIGGAMYSPTPSQRMLIVNSQVFHEGDQPYQGMVLEEIRLKSAVFSYRGHRYSVSY